MKGLRDQIDEIATNPFDDTSWSLKLSAAVPLRKIPTLVLCYGTALYDSHVICAYFDQIGTGPAHIPHDVGEQAQLLTIAAMAGGVRDAAFSIVVELRRPTENSFGY